MNDHQRRIFRLAQDITTILASDDTPDTPVHLIARMGGLAREELVAAGLDSDVLQGLGDYHHGYLLSERASVAAYRRGLLDEYVPCWNDPIDYPTTVPGRHQWEWHPDSTPEQRERGWRRYRCSRCHRQAEEDSSG